jgi:hypothetical protein
MLQPMRRWILVALLPLACNRAGGTEPAPAAVVTATTASAARGSAPTAAPTASAASAPTAAPSGQPEPVLETPSPGAGTYVSAACTGRSYERVVTLGADGSVEIVDRVSPCPPGAKCVWSGIVVRTGTFSVQSHDELGKPFRVSLVLGGVQDPKANALPSHLLWWESRGVLTEPDASCSYRRQL